MRNHQIIECPYNPAMRAAWWPKRIDYERNTQLGGYLQIQFHCAHGWCDIDDGYGGFDFADHPLVALAKAHRMFKDETIEAFVEMHGSVPEKEKAL